MHDDAFTLPTTTLSKEYLELADVLELCFCNIRVQFMIAALTCHKSIGTNTHTPLQTHKHIMP